MLRLPVVVMTGKMRHTKYYSLINIFQAPFPWNQWLFGSTWSVSLRGGAVRAPRHPTANHRHSIQDTNLLSPGEFLAMKENANSRRNMQVVGDMYARVMRALAEKEGKGESYPSLKEAPVERLPYLVEKFIQAARKSNMEVYASGTFHFIWNRVANILSSRETDPVNVKTDVNFRRAREILARSFLLLEY